MHGYTIVQFIQQASRDVLKVEEGALYPALHRLEVRGLLKARMGGVGEQPAREVLPADGARPPRARSTKPTYWERVAGARSRA